jgi:hypothetical protein
MKKYLIALIFAFLVKSGFGQTTSLVGAWHWSDSTTETSIFFDKDGGVSMHSGLKGEVILTKNLRKGKYVIKTNMVVITWADNRVENDKFKFIDKNSLQISIPDKQATPTRRDLIFRRVVDEEVIEEKIP